MILASSAGGHGGFGIHEMKIVGSTLLVVCFLIGLAVAANSQVGLVPKGLAAAFEHVFDWLDGMAQDMIGPAGREYVPFLMSIFLFVLVSNWGGLLPWPALAYTPHQPAAQMQSHDDHGHGGEGEHHEATQEHHEPEMITYESPSASINTTLALAMISFFAFNFYGIRKCWFPPKAEHDESHHDHPHDHAKGGPINGTIDWLLHFFQPTPLLWRTMEGGMKYALVPLMGVLFICLNVVEELARILSLSIRLFGNISGEHAVKLNLLATLQNFLGSAMGALSHGSPAVLGWGAMAGLIWGAAIFATCLGALAGFIQAMIFAVLTLVYIAHAVADDH